MLLNVRRLGGIALCALVAACPSAVGTPTAKATANPSTDVKVGQVVQLDGTGSTSGTGAGEMTFTWSFAKLPEGSRATLNSPDSQTPSFVADVPGTFTVQLVVANAVLASAPAKVDVVVTACGSNKPVTGTLTATPAAPGVGVTVSVAAAATDADNDAACGLNQALTYQWRLIAQPAGSTVALNNGAAVSPSFVPDVAGDYTVRLIVTDSTGRASAPGELKFTVADCGSNAPTVDSITPSVERPGLGQSVQLSPVVSDRDNLAACGSQGQTFAFKWTALNLPQGSTAALNSDVSANPSFVTDVVGAYSFRLVATDSTGRASLPKDITVTATACGGNPPVAVVASSPAAPQIGTAIQLSSTITDDDNGAACNLHQTFNHQWSLRALPAGSRASLNNPASENPTFSADVAGSYVVELVVTDSAGVKSAAVQRTISVNACGTAAPVVAPLAKALPAGAPNPGQQVTVTAAVTDADDLCKPSGAANQKQTFAWSLPVRPVGSNAFIEDPTATSSVFTTDVAGTYQVSLTVTDETGLRSAPRFLDVVTTSCGLAVPVVGLTSATPAQPNPGQAVTLAAAWTDADNVAACGAAQTVFLTWTLVGRPAASGAALATPVTPSSTASGASQNVVFTPDAIGTYQFAVAATDSKGLTSAPAFVTFTTTTCGATAPTVSAAAASAAAPATFLPALTNLTPKQTVTLRAVPADGDNSPPNASCNAGQTFTYLWRVFQRPPASKAVISDPSAAQPTFVPDVSGDYQLAVRTTDSTGLSSAEAFVSLSVSTCGEVGPTVAGITAGPAGPKVGNTITLGTGAITANNCLVPGSTYTYQWRLESRPSGSSAAIGQPTAPAPTFLADKAGDYQVSVVVTNPLGYSSDKLFLTIPVAQCGQLPLVWDSTPITRTFFDPQGSSSLHVGAQVTLAAHFTDPNGDAAACGPAIPVTPYTYRWAILSTPAGSRAALTATDAAQPGFVPDVQGDYQVSAMVTDALGNSSPTQVFKVSTSRCGANVPQLTFGANPASLNTNQQGAYSASVANDDNDGTKCPVRFVTQHTTGWSISRQPVNGQATLSSATGSSVSFAATVPGAYGVTAVATAASSGLSSVPQEQAITVNTCGAAAPTITGVTTRIGGTPTSRPPVGSTVRLNATTATPSCGAEAAASYTWSVTKLPSGSSLQVPAPDQASSSTDFLLDVAGTYEFAVTAKSAAGLVSAPLAVVVTTAACSPQVAAITPTPGAGFTIGNAVTLAAATPTDSCITSPTFTYAWTTVSKPVGSSAALTTLTAQTTTTTPDVVGRYVFQVVATDNAGLVSAPASITLDVAGCAAGGAVLTLSPADPVEQRVGGALTATPDTGDLVTFSVPTSSISDPNTGCGSISTTPYSYQWALASAPAGSTAQLTSTTAARPSLVADRPGAYVLAVTVTDAIGTASPTVFHTMNVSACGSSVPVITSVTVPTSRPGVNSAVTLTATAFDADTAAGGACATPRALDSTFLWTLVSAPAGVTAGNASSDATWSSTPSSTSSKGFTAQFGGTYVWSVAARDGAGHVSAPVTVSVATGACGPALAALGVSPGGLHRVGDAITVQPGAATTDPCIAAPQVTSSYAIISRPAGSSATITIDSALSLTPAGTFTADAPGTYLVQLLSQDQAGNASTATASIDVGPCTAAPTLAAIASSTLLGFEAGSMPFYGDRVTLSSAPTAGTCGGAQNGTFTWSWSMISRPAGSSAQLSAASVASPSFVVDVADADYQVAVTVTDNLGNTSAPRYLNLHSSSCGFEKPVVSLPTSATVNTFGTLLVQAAASVPAHNAACPGALQLSAADFTYAWSLVSGPLGGALQFSTTTASSTNVSPQAPSNGVPYLAAVDVTSGRGVRADRKTIAITADACGANAPQAVDTSAPLPVAKAFTARQTVNGVALTPHSNGDSNVLVRNHEIDVTANVIDLDSVTTTAGGCGLPPQPLTVAWSLASAPAGSSAVLRDTASLTTSFVPDLGGSYVLSLTARDGSGFATTSTFTVLVDLSCGNNAPAFTGAITASPVPNTLAVPVTFTAVASDADAACGLNDPTRFAWRVLSAPAGSAAAIGNVTTLTNTSSTASFVPDRAGAYAIGVTATDSVGLSASTSTSFTITLGVNPPTVAALSATQVVPTVGGPTTLTGGTYYQGTPVLLSATSTDPDTATNCGPTLACTWAWSFLSVPAGSAAALGNAHTAAPSFTPDAAGSYAVRLTVSLPDGRSRTVDFAGITAGTCGANAPVADFAYTLPVAASSAGTFAVATGSLVQVDAASSSDADVGTCNLAQTLSYSWTLVSRPATSSAALTSTTLRNPAFTADADGTYTLRLTVSDGARSNTVTRTVIAGAGCGNSPTAVAGMLSPEVWANLPSPLTVGTSAALQLNAGNSTASDACVPTVYAWQLTRPGGSAAALSNAAAVAPTFTPDVAGTYTVQLTVSLGARTSTVTKTLVAGAGCGVAPTAVAGLLSPEVFASLPASLTVPTAGGLQLNGAASTANDPCVAGPVAYTWALTRPGGSAAALSSTSAVNPSFTPDVAGTYTVQLTATHGSRTNAVSKNFVAGAGCGVAPTAGVGTLQPTVVASAPASTDISTGISVQVNGATSASADACLVSPTLTYTWALTRPGGSSAVLSSTTAVTSTFTADVSGTYTVQLTVSDGTRTGTLSRNFVASGALTSTSIIADYHAMAIDPTDGNPVMAVLDRSGTGTVTAWKCTANCGNTSSATWTQLGAAVDTNVGAPTEGLDERLRPVDVAVDATGQVAVVYKTLGLSGAGMRACGAGLATFTGGVWHHRDIGLDSTAPLGGCSADGTAGDQLARWLSLAMEPSGRMAVAMHLHLTSAANDFAIVVQCSSGVSCNAGNPADGMGFVLSLVSSAGVPSALGQLIMLTPFDSGSGRGMLAFRSNVATQIQVLELNSSYLQTVAGLVTVAGGFTDPRLADLSGAATVAYRDVASGTVRLVACTAGTCGSPTTVDGGGGVDAGTDLAFVLNGAAAQLAYFDVTNDNLKLATAASTAGPFTFSVIAKSPTSISLAQTAGGAARLGFTTAPGGTAIKTFAK